MKVSVAKAIEIILTSLIGRYGLESARPIYDKTTPSIKNIKGTSFFTTGYAVMENIE